MDQIIGYFTNASSIQIYLIIFGLLIAGAFAFPFPEEITFLSVGYASYMGWIHPVMGAVVGFASVLMGDTIIYFLGNKLGMKIFSLPVLRNIITKKAILKGHGLLNKHGSKLVFFSKFVVGLRYSVFFASGMMEIGYKKFISFDAMASMINIPVLVTLAYFNGRHIHHVIRMVREVNRAILITVLAVIFVLIVANYIKNRIESAKGI